MAPLRDTSAGHHHRTRSTVAAVGLERLQPAGPERLPSDRPGPCGPGGLCRVCCSRAQHRPAPCRLLRAWGCLVKGRRVASSYPALPRTALQRSASRRSRARTGAAKKMRLTDFCNRFPSRAPCGLLCFWPRLYATPRLDGGSRFEAQAHPGPEPSGVRSWGDPSARIPDEPARWNPCLTAKLQLQPSPQPSREPPKGCLLARPGAVPRAPT